MAKIDVIWRTVMATHNPFVALSLKTGKTRKSVTFRNSKLTLCLTWDQFRVFRDNFAYLNKYTVTQLADDLFRVNDAKSEVTCKAELLPLMFDLMRDFAVHQEQELYHLKNEGLELIGSLAMLDCFQEVRKGDYQCDCKDKIVLDVGGFEGESAVYFWFQGAKKVVVYEPVLEHIDLIKRNLELNEVKAELHQSGIGNKDGTQIVEYSKTDPGFGISHKGPNSLEITITDISKVIAESSADIGKFDCEGAEQYLTGVPTKILRKIAYYIIETHSPEIRANLLEKFLSAGFTLEKERSKSWRYSVLTFKRIDE
jgi:FkbM family methyltransferase